MEVAFETIFLLPFYPHLHVLDRELCLKYYRGKKKKSYFYLHIFIFQLSEKRKGKQKKTKKTQNNSQTREEVKTNICLGVFTRHW